VATLDPAIGWRRNSVSGFLAEWDPTGRLMLVVSPPASLPRPIVGAMSPEGGPGSR
jgi:hypothetical protein